MSKLDETAKTEAALNILAMNAACRLCRWLARIRRVGGGRGFSIGPKYVPSFIDIGKKYARLVEDAQPDETKYPEELYKILMSKVSECMTECNSEFYCSPRDYLLLAYRSKLE